MILSLGQQLMGPEPQFHSSQKFLPQSIYDKKLLSGTVTNASARLHLLRAI